MKSPFRKSALRHSKRPVFFAAACGLAVLALGGCKRAVSPDVAATVNGRPITYSEMDRQLVTQVPSAQVGSDDDQVRELRLETLRSLIDAEIMLQRAEKQGLLASDSDVDARFNELKAPYTEEEFKRQLKARKMSATDFKAQLRRELSIQKLINKEIGSHISITDAEVKQFYNTNKASFNLVEPQIHLAQILVTSTPDPNVHNLKNDKAQTDLQAKEKVEMMENRLKQGEDFGMLAQSYSEDPNSAPNGGDLGLIPESALDKANPELRKIIMNMTPGQVSNVIHTPEGYRILKVISKEPAGQRDLNDPRVQESIRMQLFNKKDQLLRAAFYEVARDEAKVVNYYAESILASRDKK
ncbi:MAG TPA: peptidylprolyl isomerase [Bryobacteraceae bacterium]|nr:peptidylprolyl isomerase [Bryobacteraceae bacterium]